MGDVGGAGLAAPHTLDWPEAELYDVALQNEFLGASLMDMNKLTDGEAKDILRTWPNQSSDLWPPPGGTGFWLRAQPTDGDVAGPTLSSPGAKFFITQPDGLWVFFLDYRTCDVVVVEHCGTIQNLNDKRSRYIPASHSTVLTWTTKWVRATIKAKGRGQIPRWKATGGKLKKPNSSRKDSAEYVGAVRHLRVLYSLPNTDYHKWCSEHTPTGYEYFCPHSSLGSYNSQKMQAFLRQMSITSQFYIKPKQSRGRADAFSIPSPS
jgi:hypothetical protein